MLTEKEIQDAVLLARAEAYGIITSFTRAFYEQDENEIEVPDGENQEEITQAGLQQLVGGSR